MSTQFDGSTHPHRRFNPLTQSFVLCSPHRTKRPWQGATESKEIIKRPEYDEKCYLCPGNIRAGGAVTEKYSSTYIFENDFAALMEENVQAPPESSEIGLQSLFKIVPARGKCYVICFSPRHDLTVAEMSEIEIVGVIEAWKRLYQDVSLENPWLKYIQIFENKGSMMGCSNPHPHGQAWSMSYIPSTPAIMLKSMKDYALTQKPTTGTPLLNNGLPSLLLSYAHEESRISSLALNSSIGTDQNRVILEGNDFIAIVPFWASWPFETIILPKNRQISSIAKLTKEEIKDLANIISRVCIRMDNLFNCSFGYSMGIYQSPIFRNETSDKLKKGEEDWNEFAQFHIGFYPPLLRSATVKKFLVGFELFAETQRDITPEQAAKRLRDCNPIHYKKRFS